MSQLFEIFAGLCVALGAGSALQVFEAYKKHKGHELALTPKTIMHLAAHCVGTLVGLISFVSLVAGFMAFSADQASAKKQHPDALMLRAQRGSTVRPSPPSGTTAINVQGDGPHAITTGDFSPAFSGGQVEGPVTISCPKC